MAARVVWRPIDKIRPFQRVTARRSGWHRQPAADAAERRRIPAARAAVDGRHTSATTIWATAPGFTGWDPLPDNQPLLIADRASYRPGETATLLLTNSSAQSTALVTLQRADEITGTIRTIRAGEPLTLTLRPRMCRRSSSRR